MDFREQPVVVRAALVVVALVVGAIVGYCLGLAWIGLEVAVLGHSDAHSGRGLIAVAIAYGITGLTSLVAGILAWRRLSR